MNEDLVKKYQLLKQQHSEILVEKAKCEARRDQLMSEIKSIQEKYPEYDLSSIKSVDLIIKKLTDELDAEIKVINEKYAEIKGL